MEEMDKDTKNILIGAAIGGIVGIGAIVLISSLKNKHPNIDRVGRTLCKLGEMLDDKAHQAEKFANTVEKKIHNEENNVVSAMEWVAAGISLWNKIKKAE